MTKPHPHDGFDDGYLRALERQFQNQANDLQARAADAQRAADTCRKELRRRARERKAAAAK